jgi:hypothetical protein
MDNDNGKDIEGVIVPLSLIRALSENMIETIDRWHEERGIHSLNMGQCIVAMIAAIDAVTESINEYPDGFTIQ